MGELVKVMQMRGGGLAGASMRLIGHLMAVYGAEQGVEDNRDAGHQDA